MCNKMDAATEKLISVSAKETDKALDTFLNLASAVFDFPELNKDNKRKNLWLSLYKIALNADDVEITKKCLSAIRILSREKTSLIELVTDDWFELLKQFSGLQKDNFEFNSNNVILAVEAEKCMCNILYNSIGLAKKAYENGILDRINARIKRYSEPSFPDEIKFFDMKILFIISAHRPEIRNKLKNEMNCVAYLIETLESILADAKKTARNKAEITLTDQQVDLICEILKAVFNVTIRINLDDAEEIKQYNILVEIIREYLVIKTSTDAKKLLLQNNLINLLTNMPNECYNGLSKPIADSDDVPKDLKYKDFDMTAIKAILTVLESKFNENTTVSVQHEVLSPIVTVLLKCAESERPLRKYLKLNILPPLKDVHNRPEEGDTLRNNLCRLLTSPITQLSNIVAQFLFVLCKNNVSRMVKYTGFGNAAGLLAQRGLLGGRHDDEEFESSEGDSETEEYAEYKHGINPVVGCYEEPHANPMENMSEEQKEYEAMKLVNLIDSLAKCGTIQPCRVGADGKPQPIEHILELQEGINPQSKIRSNSDSD